MNEHTKIFYFGVTSQSIESHENGREAFNKQQTSAPGINPQSLVAVIWYAS